MYTRLTVLTRWGLIGIFGLVLLPLNALAAVPSFTSATYQVSPGPQTVASEDLNGDTFPDLITANLVDGVLSLLFNNGNGTYQEPFTPFAVGPTRDAKIAEMTSDGIPDIVAVTENVGGAVLVFPGIGNGTYLSAHETSLAENGLLSLTIADLNNDGDQDVIVPMQDTDTIRILLGDGNGTFGTINTLTSISGPRHVQAGDVNGDEVLDIVIAHMNASTIGVALGNGDGTFESEIEYATDGDENAPLYLGDMDGDGDLDIAVGNAAGTTIILGNGDGTFDSPALEVATARPAGLANVDNNEILDLVLTNAAAGAISVALGNGDGTFEDAVTVSNDFAGGVPTFIQGLIEDLNGDGTLDIAVPNYNGNTVSVLLNSGETPALPQPTKKEQCRRGGYLNYVDDNNKPFRSAGRCVHYVNQL